MLAWPSPTYPRYLSPSSPIPITLDQSAMIAGFLMIGLTLGTPLSSIRCIGVKNSMILGCLLMSIGWIVMWQASNIYLVLASRLITGFGFGFCQAKIKIYINDMSREEHTKILIGLNMPFICIGAIIIYSYGPFVTLKDVSIIAAIITVSIFSLVVFLPNTPKEFLQRENLKFASEVLQSVNPKISVQDQVIKMKMELSAGDLSIGYLGIFKDSQLRCEFGKIGLLTFFLQFTGVTPTIIYNMYIFMYIQVPNPEYFSILYMVTYFFANLFGIFVSTKYNKRTMLLLSNILVITSIVLNILVLKFQINQKYFEYTSVIVMLFYNISHAIGLGNLPVTLINDNFPANCRKTVTQFYVMLHSMCALLITKIFQVLIGMFGLQECFYLFLTVSVGSLIFITCVLTDKKDEEWNEENETK